METVLRILRAAGGWQHGLHLHINNPPYMALVIEAIDEAGPCGLPSISVAHYGEQNGDAMRDPEMCFELAFTHGVILDPFYYRNDYVGIEQWSRFLRDGQYRCHLQLYAQHVRFAQLWDRNLQQQGFAEAFARQRQPHA